MNFYESWVGLPTLFSSYCSIQHYFRATIAIIQLFEFALSTKTAMHVNFGLFFELSECIFDLFVAFEIIRNTKKLLMLSKNHAYVFFKRYPGKYIIYICDHIVLEPFPICFLTVINLKTVRDNGKINCYIYSYPIFVMFI